MHSIINVIIAHGHPHFLFSLQNIIRSYQGFRIIGNATNLTDLVKTTTNLKPDVIIADMALPGMKGFAALQKLAISCGEAKIILSLQYHHLPLISKAMEAGFAGFIMHDANPAEYSLAIKQAMKGEIFYCSQAEKVIDACKNAGTTGNALGVKLSKTQCTLLYCIWLHFNSKETAIAMQLSKDTVDTYRKALRKIIGSCSGFALERILKENGIV